MNDAFYVNFFGGNQWKTPPQVETCLVTKTAPGTCASTVGFVNALIENMLKKVEVLLHKCKV